MNVKRLIAALAVLAVSDPLRAEQLYAPPSPEAARAATFDWLNSRGLRDPDLRAAVEELWDVAGRLPTPDERFMAVVQTFYFADAGVRELVDACAAGDARRLVQGFAVVDSEGDSPFFVHNVRYFYARYLAVLTLYDEALDVFDQIDPGQVADPAGCLFYRAVCEHSLLLKDAGLKTIDALLGRTEGVPVRYATVAELMKHDLEALREKTLGEVARQMRDVERRLALGRAGEKTQRVEERIIATLDEIIEKLEQQQSGGGGGGSGGSPRGNQSGNPAEDSYLGGVKGPGEVDRRDIGHRDGWGNLPDKAQTAAKELINRQFPNHYRHAVEEYLKKIAQRPAPSRD